MENLENRQFDLVQKGKEYVKHKHDISYGLTPSRIAKQSKIKAKLLRLFKGSEEDWKDWVWQMQYRIISVEQLNEIFPLGDSRKAEIHEAASKVRFAISPYYLSLMDSCENTDPIAMMSLPSSLELLKSGTIDPMGESFANPAGSITRRYPDRVIINVTNSCASFCRHCQRKRHIGSIDMKTSDKKIRDSLHFIENHNEIRDVLVTGGDALSLADDELEFIVSKIRNVKHVEIIRIGTRMPANLPQRITPGLAQMLSKYGPIYVNTQFNHPVEITEDSMSALNILADKGIVLGNQMVLLKGINDNRHVVRFLNEKLLVARVRPYYIFHAKSVQGTTHFQTSIEKGLEIMEYLRGNTSGLAIPTYVFNAPNGLGKIPISPNYLVRESENEIILQTWENRHISIEKHDSTETRK